MLTYTSLAPAGSMMKASLLELEGVRILADPGWDGVSDISYLDSIISTVDIILLSHPTTDYIGAYAYLAFKELNIPVYSTLPTCNLGRVSTIDLYRAVGVIGPLKGTEYELSDVEEAFDKIITVKHSQSTDLRAKFDGLTLTAVNAGHTLGGTIWVINKNSEKIVYAPQWNHSKDSFLNGADVLQNPLLLRPSVIITSTAIGSSLPHKKRVESLFELVDATLGRGGTVLLPTSIGGRVLELIHLIDEHLQSAPIPVLLISYANARSLTYAGSMLEWMAPAVIREWESKGQAPFDASRVQVVDPSELLNLPGAKVVFASGAGFENGSSAQAALMSLCEDEKTTIILTEKSPYGTIGNDLYFTWRKITAANNGKTEDGMPIALQKELSIRVIREDILVGNDKIEYETHVKERRLLKEQKKQAKLSEKKETQFEDDSESESEDEDVLDISEKEEVIPVDVDVRNLKGRAKMFPFIPNKSKFDEYGEIINHSDYTREEEKDVGKFKRSKDKNVKIGEKKKWNEGKKQDDVSHIDALFEPRVRNATDIIMNSRCVLSFVDLSGTVDVRSLSLIIPSLKPKNVLLIADIFDKNDPQLVSASLRKHNNFEIVEIQDNVPVTANDALQSFDILLDERLTAHLKWQKIAGGFTVAHVIGELKTKEALEELKEEQAASESPSDDTVVKDESKMEEDTETSEDLKRKDEYVLTALPQNSNFLSNIRAAPLAIGDVRLSELKRALAPRHRVEFKGEGTLVVDEIVAIRKITDGNVIVDGLPGALFYEVRDTVRNVLAYV